MKAKLAHTNIYFTGKVLNVKEIASDNAKSFRFSDEERQQLNLKGLPIRLEHEDNLEVGTIKTSWNKNGEHWVFGSINKQSIPATFAKHALMKGADGNQKPYYTGLSLQHLHREFPNGTTEKKGIEVSLCTDPRRPNCNIIWTSTPQSQTNNNTYKLVQQLASKNRIMTNSETTPNTTQENTQVEQPSETSGATSMQVEAPTGKELSDKVYDELAKLMESEQKQQEKIIQLEKQLEQHNKTLAQEKDKKQKEDAAKGRALMNTFLEHVKELVGDQDGLQQQVEPMIQSNPEGMGRIMEVVSKASKKYAENSLALQQAKASLKDKELELKFQQLIQGKTIGNPATTEITQAASSKKRAQPAVTSAVVARAASSTNAVAVNPYATARRHGTTRAPQRQAQRRIGGMNENLLKVYNSVRGDGIQAMQKLHKSLTERPRYF
tara:strand:+ start:401 stop:1711 length:1311 start_codon:yes stop_codon:yes gene_type:complete